MPKVSILIPTHNRAETIGLSVNSALSQTEQDVEVIVYDDGSDEMDGLFEKKGKITKISPPTETILGRIKDPRLKYVQCKTNHGAAYSRNKLMEMATGEYSMWLDSDDVSNQVRVELCLKAIKKYKTAYVRTAITTYGKDAGNTWLMPPLVVYRGGVSFATIMFPTKNRILFDTAYTHCCEDMDWELRYAAKYGRSIYIPMTLYGVGRKAQDRLTMRNKIKSNKDTYEADKKRYAKKADKVVEEMKRNGKTKLPLVVPWEFIAEFQSGVYNTHYGKRTP